ncbi:PAS domain S-box protein [Limnoglobus roseus]|uniref:histidine kinase n=1 Tax=Limnoglobus roseus TaxID=2598579 RepID=A0A5C1AFC1_9BACT|nr:PAS domain S-box protein [Limnoglobus roseus]QEL16666.1 hybrid sensor histidine kinase/response regulator [Limnoglobus roseus]
MPINDNQADEVQRLRDTMRELVALSTLPAAWAGYAPDGVARSLAGVLRDALSLDLVYVLVRGFGNVELALGQGFAADALQLRVIADGLAPVLNPQPPVTVADPLGGGEFRVAVTRFGHAGDLGVVVACSRRSDFPNESDRLLLSVGANQTAIVLQRKRAERALRESEERLRVTLSSIGDAVIATDAEGRVTFMNAVAEALTGWPLADAAGRQLPEVFRIVNEYTREPGANPALRALNEGVTVGLANHTVLIARDGTERPIDDSAAPIRDGKNPSMGAVLVFRDVTERKRSESEAVQLAERLRLALDAGDLGTWEWNPATDEMTVSPRASEMYGTPVGVPHGREQGRMMIHPDDRERARLAAEKAVAERTDYDIEYRLADRPAWVAAHGRGLYDAAGRLVRVHGVVQDITERKRAEDEAAGLAERLRLALEAGGTGVWEWDVVTGRITWSDQVHAFYGLAPGEFDGTFEMFARHLYPDDAARAGDAIRASVEDDVPYRIEYRIVPKGGGLRWISTAGRVIRDAAGKPLRMVGATVDVTERRLTEDTVRASEKRFRTLFDSMDQGFCVIEVTFEGGRAADYRFVELNPAFERHSGLPRNLIGASIREAVPGLEEFWFDTYGRVAATGEPTRFVHPAAPLGRWFEVYAFRLEDPDRCRVAVLFADITDRKRAEEELRDQDRKKDDFIALLAHELRNPLAPIRNGLQVLRLGGANPEPLARARDMMDRQLTHMVRLIDDLLDVSRINRGKMELRRGRVELADVVGSAVETARPALDVGKHELMVTLPATPVALDADLTRLAQVFSNLLTNSAKYTPKGGRVWLSAERTDGHVRVTVRDTGIGIPAESLPTIFDMFSQVDRSVERSTGGLGIGLALVKGLVEMHDGTVAAASEGEGLGTTFTVTLPVVTRVEASVPLVTEAPTRTPARRILVVDDNRDGAESMGDMLSMLGHEVATAHDGLGAVERAEAFRPDVILMDVGMPRLNGLDASRRIREQPWGQGIAIVALTGWGQENDRERSREAGCNAHLVKPVDFTDLQRVLAEVTR